MKKLIATIAALVAAGALAAPAQAEVSPFPASWNCVAPPAGAAWQAWHCKAYLKGVLAGRNPGNSQWAKTASQQRIATRAANLGIPGLALAGAGCEHVKANRWRCTVLFDIAYVAPTAP